MTIPDTRRRQRSDELLPETRTFFREVMQTLAASSIPTLVGGAYAFERYTGIVRHTKDLDLFIRRRDLTGALEVLKRAGHRTEFTFPHWLGKVFGEHGDLIDLIFSSGNGVAEVDDDWFDRAESAKVLDVDVLLCPPEEIIWTKTFIMERERYDGADVAHLILHRGRHMDWKRLITRMGPHFRVLLAHVLLFGYIYPADRERVPDWVTRELFDRVSKSLGPETTDVCRGTLLSREQYLVDVLDRGYRDGREAPVGRMSPCDIRRWTEAIYTGE